MGLIITGQINFFFKIMYFYLALNLNFLASLMKNMYPISNTLMGLTVETMDKKLQKRTQQSGVVIL